MSKVPLGPYVKTLPAEFLSLRRHQQGTAASCKEVFVRGHSEEYGFHVDDFLSDECSNEHSGDSTLGLDNADEDHDGDVEDEEEELGTCPNEQSSVLVS